MNYLVCEFIYNVVIKEPENKLCLPLMSSFAIRLFSFWIQILSSLLRRRCRVIPVCGYVPDAANNTVCIFPFFILHDVKMNRIAWMAHEATGNSVDTLVGCSKYPRGRSISSTYIGQHFVILHDSKTGDVCVFWQKCSESNRWYPFSYK